MTNAAPALFFSVFAIFLSGNARGQAFEAVSIKPSGPNTRGFSMKSPKGTFDPTGMTARIGIMLAYDVQPFQLEGGPSWIADERYDVVAKLPAGALKGPQDPERMAQMRAALQVLLADRFRLAIHRETKVVPAYVLVTAKSGLKLKETADDGRGADISSNRGKLVAERISMGTLARNLSGNIGSPVVDITGIKGIFNLTLEWTPDAAPSAA